MANRPMTLDLLTSLAITEDDVSAVVDAYMRGPTSGPVPIGAGYRVDPAAAVAEHPFAATLINQPWARPELQRLAVRAAIMLAQPDRV